MISRKKHPISAILGTLCITAFLPATARAQWTFTPSIPVPRWSVNAVAGQDGTIYAIGGFDDTSVLGTMERYEPLTQAWTSLPPMPTPRANAAATVADDGRIFVFGGSDGPRSFDVVEAYDPSTNTWTEVTPMPTVRGGPGAATGYDGRIYVIGGSQVSASGEVFVRVVEAYDPRTDSWASVAPLPSPRSHLSAVLGMDGRIYAIGGRNSTSLFLPDVTVYDPGQDSWRPVAPLPTRRYNLAAAVALDGRIYALGGVTVLGAFPQPQATDAVEVYDPSSDRWLVGCSMLTPREGLGAVRGADDRIYAVFGLHGYYDGRRNHRIILNTVEAYAP
jgi:N-acetylneuraminic acid mutarotase